MHHRIGALSELPVIKGIDRSIFRLLLAAGLLAAASGCGVIPLPIGLQPVQDLPKDPEGDEGEEVSAECVAGRACPIRNCALQLHDAPEVVGHEYPRFFPVPTRPVFSPGCDCPMCRPPVELIQENSSPLISAGNDPLQIEIALPGPIPERVLRPGADVGNGGAKRQDRTTRVPGRADAAGRVASWVFKPPVANESELLTIRPRATANPFPISRTALRRRSIRR